MKRALFPVLFLFTFVAISPLLAKDPPPSSESASDSSRITYRRLTWDDFRIDDRSPGMSAQTHTFTTFSFKSRVQGSNGSYVAVATSITFEGGFDRQRSWRRSYVNTNSELLLDHEQGHFDIAQLKLRQLRAWKLEELPTATGSSPDTAYQALKKRLQGMYRDEIKDLEATQNRYDKETDHGTRRDVQTQWRQRIDRALQSNPAPK